MVIQRKSQCLRQAAVLVEMAAVIIVFVMLLFGILEYCRFIFMRQLIVNAGREGARYAALHTLNDTVATDTEAKVRARMGGMDDKLSNFTVQLYAADADGNNIGDATDAEFGEYIAVEIECDYDPILPILLFMQDRIHLSSKTLMYSEAN